MIRNYKIEAFVILILMCFITACDNKIIEYHDNGQVRKEYFLKDNKLDRQYKEYFTNGKLKLVHNYNLGKKIDSSIYYYKTPVNQVKFIRHWLKLDSIRQIEYYENGNLKNEGIVNDSFLKIGKWKFFDERGFLDVVRDYKMVNGSHYLNQVWDINVKGDTLYNKSSYFEVKVISDTISNQEPLLGAFFLRAHLFKSKLSEVLVCFSKDENNSINKDFSNINEIKLDTFYNLQHDIKNQENFNGYSKPYTVAFGKWFKKSSGTKIIRGFAEEYYPLDDQKGFNTFRYYFEVPIYIIEDTIIDNN